jgi:hypothetical protein
MRIAVVVIVAGLAQGCMSAEVVSSSATGVWLKEPMFGAGFADETAADECRRYGKTAVFRGTLQTPEGFMTPVRAYDCR